MSPYYWTPEEEAYMREHYGRKTSAQIAMHLRRSKGSVRIKACKMGLTDTNRNAPKVVGPVLSGPNVIVHRTW